MKHFRWPRAFFLMLISYGALAQSQPASNYEDIIHNANAQLQTGNNDRALFLANEAIKINPKKWEAYAISGGALKNLNRCNEAVRQFDLAIQLSPSDKKSSLSSLNEQCLAIINRQSPSSGPSLQQIQSWIQSNTPSQVETPKGRTYGQTIVFSGCGMTLTISTIKEKSGLEPPIDKRNTDMYVLNDIAKLNANNITTSQDGPGSVTLVTNENSSFLVHSTGWSQIGESDEWTSTLDESDQESYLEYNVQNQDMATRMAHAWHDAIIKCQANDPSMNLY